jgi:RNA polymerase sigma-70 factor (ECF subfamily)
VSIRKELQDQEIFDAFRHDSGKGLDLMFRQYYPFVCQVVHRILLDNAQSEDLAQEVFYEIWKKKDAFQITTSLKAYLRRAAINKTLNYLRDKKIKWDDEDQLSATESSQPSISQELEGEELQRLIDRTIDGLPERCRLVFSLSRFEEMSYLEIADHLGISVKTVENQMSKALRILRDALAHRLNH